MSNREQSQLVDEKYKGARAEAAYKEFIKPFIEANQKSIYDAFMNSDPEDTERLSELRRMTIVVSLLDGAIKSYIDTGRMAVLSLKEAEQNGN